MILISSRSTGLRLPQTSSYLCRQARLHCLWLQKQSFLTTDGNKKYNKETDLRGGGEGEWEIRQNSSLLTLPIFIPDSRNITGLSPVQLTGACGMQSLFSRGRQWHTFAGWSCSVPCCVGMFIHPHTLQLQPGSAPSQKILLPPGSCRCAHV